MGQVEYVFVGGSTSKGGRTGISVFRFHENRAVLERVGEVGGIENPSYLSVDARRGLVYACSETEHQGALVTFRFDPRRATLTKVGSLPTLGAYPCFNRISRDRRHVLTANYGSIQANRDVAVTAFGLDEAGIPSETIGILELSGAGPNKDRQERSHPHSVMETATNNVFAVADLGTDLLSLIKLGRNGDLEISSQVVMPAGCGPRHMRLHPNGRFTLICGELDSTVLCLDANFALVDRKSTLPPETAIDNTAAEICIAPDGRYVYLSNRGHNSIAVFGFDADTGLLNPLGHTSSNGTTPRHFQLTRSGKHLIVANQGSDNLVVLQRDPHTGILADTGSAIHETAPTCIKSAAYSVQ